jgi:hypothetical protein
VKRQSIDREIDPKDIKFLVNTYQEHTLAYGKQTLTIFGEPDLEDIARVIAQYDDKDIEHLHFGAERSFACTTLDAMEEWIAVITHFLTLDYWVTLEVDVSLVNLLQESQLLPWNRFIPLLSIRIPFAYEMGYNASIKIDDVQFNHSNTGIWCHQIHDLLDYNRYTCWSDYKDDIMVTPDGKDEIK